MTPSTPERMRSVLHPDELEAARALIRRIGTEVPAELLQVSLFGSRARGDARPDSDLDLLLVFRRLPPDREPHASHAEELAEEMAAESGIPLTVWAVSLVDLERGLRTPMLVDALADSIPLWCREAPVPRVPFTPEDAVRCAGALLDRVGEGEAEVGEHLERGDAGAAALRVRDDLIRMCVGLHLLRGETRPRRGEAARALLSAENGALPPPVREALEWAAGSYGPEGRDEEAAVPEPADPVIAVRSVGHLRRLVARRRERLSRSLSQGVPREPSPPSLVTASEAPGLHRTRERG